MDIWSSEKRSQVMSRILSKNTKPERIVRSMLHSMGYRFRLHVNNIAGKPDIVLKKYNTVIFVHGCFWHLHDGCIDGRIPKTRTEYWEQKLFANKARDEKHMKELRDLGWKVLKFWECEVERNPGDIALKIKRFLS